MSAARVVLLEDDPAIRSLIAFALEDLGLDLVMCINVPQAIEALAARPARLFITDLMLPGESGLSLLQRHTTSPLFGPDTRVAVFSAGITAPMRAQLEPLGVWRFMSKPASMKALRECVQDALAEGGSAPQPASVPVPPVDGRAAVDQFFGGNARLFASYSQTCARQFPDDLRTGDKAAAGDDSAALLALGHNLKTVLLMLGANEASRHAAALEAAASRRDGLAARNQWSRLRLDLARIAGAAPWTGTPAA